MAPLRQKSKQFIARNLELSARNRELEAAASSAPSPRRSSDSQPRRHSRSRPRSQQLLGHGASVSYRYRPPPVRCVLAGLECRVLICSANILQTNTGAAFIIP